jgi:AAA family ATP:ADP antiporter
MPPHAPIAVDASASLGLRLLNRLPGLNGVRSEELKLGLIAGAWFFCILASYYVLRPIRDAMGIAGGVGNLAWIWLGTLSFALLLSPLFAALVRRYDRQRLVRVCFRIIGACLVLFVTLLETLPKSALFGLGVVFFIWLSVYTVFAVSLFWAVMADIVRREQAPQLYGLVAAGGTLGGVVGAGLTGALVQLIGASWLLLLALVLLELGLRAMTALNRQAKLLDRQQSVQADAVIGGGILAAFSLAAHSRYLRVLSAYMMLFTVGSSVLYFLQADLVERTIASQEARAAYFARIDLLTNATTLLLQLGVTAALWRKIGVRWLLAVVPLVSLIGFVAYALVPIGLVMAAFQIARRAGQFALSSPARESLYVSLNREQKYKAKTMIDTVIFRLGDQLGAWSFNGLLALGLTGASISLCALPISGVMLACAFWLGQHSAQGASHD